MRAFTSTTMIEDLRERTESRPAEQRVLSPLLSVARMREAGPARGKVGTT